VTDPRKILLTLGWCPKRHLGASETFMLGLLKSKVMSMACQYGRNPIIWALAKNLLSKLTNIKIRQSVIDSMDAYKRDEFKLILEKNSFDVGPPGMATRLLVERLYGISISLQLECEKELLDCKLGPWTPPLNLFSEKHAFNWKYTQDTKWTFYEDIVPQAWMAQILEKAEVKSVKQLYFVGGDVKIRELSAYLVGISDRCYTL
jgi:hypothetical protein